MLDSVHRVGLRKWNQPDCVGHQGVWNSWCELRGVNRGYGSDCVSQVGVGEAGGPDGVSQVGWAEWGRRWCLT